MNIKGYVSIVFYLINEDGISIYCNNLWLKVVYFMLNTTYVDLCIVIY